MDNIFLLFSELNIDVSDVLFLENSNVSLLAFVFITEGQVSNGI